MIVSTLDGTKSMADLEVYLNWGATLRGRTELVPFNPVPYLVTIQYTQITEEKQREVLPPLSRVGIRR